MVKVAIESLVLARDVAARLDNRRESLGDGGRLFVRFSHQQSISRSAIRLLAIHLADMRQKGKS